MSALPIPPSPSDLPQGVHDGILGVAIGVVSWLVRYACSTEKHTLAYIARRTATAGLTAALAGAASKGYFNSEGMAFAAAGVCAYASPEIVDFGLSWIKSRTPRVGK